MTKQVMERHAKTMARLSAVADRCLEPDQRVIIMVYDSARIIGRQLSYHATNASDADVAAICRALAQQTSGERFG